jgi:hypothetical protein
MTLIGVLIRVFAVLAAASAATIVTQWYAGATAQVYHANLIARAGMLGRFEFARSNGFFPELSRAEHPDLAVLREGGAGAGVGGGAGRGEVRWKSGDQAINLPGSQQIERYSFLLEIPGSNDEPSRWATVVRTGNGMVTYAAEPVGYSWAVGKFGVFAFVSCVGPVLLLSLCRYGKASS